MSRKILLLQWTVALALLASAAPSARAGSINGVFPAAGGGTETRAIPVPEPTAAVLLTVGGGVAVLAMLRRTPRA